MNVTKSPASRVLQTVVPAAGLSRTETIAAVLGTDPISSGVAFSEGFALDTRYVNPEIEVIATHHPGDPSIAFKDPNWGAATARQAWDQKTGSNANA
ncbi:MAG: hypothetical protein F4Y80_04615 [Caldilineaceae bacterium SB0665_bin_21]|nr:hypothetical protein [Caldilineaceae bacterium SB0665_bin_21]MYA05733.1 hypothetical protein [Caldilineaceae bacterium SB0664_bin_22]MYC64179.1 hypothetical protein [Caldilineaceae bacterium SB0661_bin_34]